MLLWYKLVPHNLQWFDNSFRFNEFSTFLNSDRPSDIAVSVGSLEFDSRALEIGHSVAIAAMFP